MSYTVRPISDRTAFTGRHVRSQFATHWSATEGLLLREVKHLRGRDLVLELDLTEGMIRLDGRPRSDARPTTPGVRVAFSSMHGPLTYATDKFTTWQDNVRAIALGLEALRKVDRYGITKRGEQYTGWKALPGGPGVAMGGMTRDQALAVLRSASAWPDWEGPVTSKLVRSARGNAHPDRHGGDRTLWDQVEQAATVLGLT